MPESIADSARPSAESRNCDHCEHILALERERCALQAEVNALQAEVSEGNHQLSELAEQIVELTDQVSGLTEERDDARRDIEAARSDTDAALENVERLEGLIAEPSDLVDATRKLLGRLEESFGVEHWDESLVAYQLFRAMDDVRDALRELPERNESVRSRKEPVREREPKPEQHAYGGH